MSIPRGDGDRKREGLRSVFRLNSRKLAGIATLVLMTGPGGTAFAAAQDENASQPAPEAPSAQAPEPRFDILEYVIDGNSVLSVVEIERVVYPFLGEQRTAGDVDRAREDLENAYHLRGFQTVQVTIPQQGVESGIIHL